MSSCYDVENTPTEYLRKDLKALQNLRAVLRVGYSDVDRRRFIDVNEDIAEITAELKKRADTGQGETEN